MTDDGDEAAAQQQQQPTQNDVQAAISVLQRLTAKTKDASESAHRRPLALGPLVKAAAAYADAVGERQQNNRQRRKRKREAQDQATLDKTGIRQLRRDKLRKVAGALLPPTTNDADQDAAPVSGPDPGPQAPAVLQRPLKCYVCHELRTEVHPFYDSMCMACGDLNWQRRHQTADLSGLVCLVTGARVKIGYETCLKLLRAGARVIATTRFPRDAAQRYGKEADFAAWSTRLHIYGLDFRHLPTVEAFAQHIVAAYTRLDILINNAAQTIRRPPVYYQHLLAAESAGAPHQPALLHAPSSTTSSHSSNNSTVSGGPNGSMQLVVTDFAPSMSTTPSSSAALSQLVLLDEDRPGHFAPDVFPVGRYDADAQQVDLRAKTSWVLPAQDVSTVEAAEVHIINALAPFALASRLVTFMSPCSKKDDAKQQQNGNPPRLAFIVNVSSMEGKFSKHKDPNHPHTNMAKAALNMFTRTSANQFAAKFSVLMNAVDTGWVTDEYPLGDEKHHKPPPLDEIDGAARILDPVFQALNHGRMEYGCFFKDYAPTTW